ncbi:DUF1508 domain-containing protein [Phenylobacterium sp.]|uniref:DUF4926 domain-containing protein n=1 Tax=Phenylobacterium sp. TaxID=1871053 RepID=UPI0027186C00|nr:DUF1508 domain-containing protein [Phenylobacterium sp.]MDO8801906.1 DUF1508 domain-containing protein [Phenylobacterium sp.]
MVGLLDIVTLRRSKPDLGLDAGRQGAVIHVHSADAYEVEFVDDTGSIVTTLGASDVGRVEPGQDVGAVHLELYSDPGGAYRWRLVAANGELIAHSESYGSKEDCLRGIQLAVRSIREAPILDRTAA